MQVHSLFLSCLTIMSSLGPLKFKSSEEDTSTDEGFLKLLTHCAPTKSSADQCTTKELIRPILDSNDIAKVSDNEFTFNLPQKHCNLVILYCNLALNVKLTILF